MKPNKSGQPKRSRSKLTVDLASFPELNPNPIGEVDLDGQIHYLNPAVRRLFPALKTKGLAHPWLADWKSVADFFRHRKTKSMTRQVTIDGRCYDQAMYFVARIRRVRIYGLDITARKKAEEALARSNSQLAQVLDSIQDDFYVLGRDWKFVFASRQFTSRIGKEPQDFVGNCIWEMFPKHVGTVLEENYRATMEKREIRRFEVGGKYTDAWYSMACFPSDEGITVLGTEITARKKMQEALRESEQRLQQASDLLEAVTAGTNVIIAAQDTQLRYTFFNKPYQEEIKRLTGKDLTIGMSMADLFADMPEQQAVAVREWSRTLAGESANDTIEFGDVARYRKTYSRLHTPLRDAEGHIVGAGEVAYDITPLKQAEEALRESQRKYQDLTETTSDSIWEMDSQGRYTYCSPQMGKLWGIKPEEMIGKTPFDVMPPAEKEQALEYFRRLAASPAPFTGVTTTAYDSQGRLIFIETNGVPFFDSHGGLLGFRGISRDVTERKRKDAELQRLNRTLRALSNINQAMMRVQDEAEFLQRVCQIVVEDCGHAMVWIGYAEEDEAKTVRPVAHAGFEVGYLETLKITWADTERGRGPTGTAIRTGKPSACRNMLTDPRFKPWREEALRRGYASSIVLPLMANGKAFGAINIYSREPDSFSDDEVNLLSELADDLAFGIMANRLRVAHARAEEALRKSRDELEQTVADRTAELKLANERLRALTHDAVTTQEEERRRVSLELHDEAGQALTALKLSLQLLRDELSSTGNSLRQHLEEAISLTDRTIEQIRMLAQGLRPPALESAGLNSTLQGLCGEFARRTQIQINYSGTELPDLGPASICLYRFLQEALTNAVRHGHATEIQVRLERDAEQVCLAVEDNGQGFDTQRVLSGQENPKSMGLIGMQERIKMVGGRLEIDSKPGCGARLIAHVPVEEA